MAVSTEAARFTRRVGADATIRQVVAVMVGTEARRYVKLVGGALSCHGQSVKIGVLKYQIVSAIK